MKKIISICSIISLFCCDLPDQQTIYLETVDPALGIRKICIENHVYYAGGYRALAIKLDDDGKPCYCEN